MPIIDFPPVELASPEGVVGIGGDLDPQSLLLAYSRGIFPWPHGKLLAWFSPNPRAVLDFECIHLSASLRRAMRRIPYSVSVDKAFETVIRRCASQERPEQAGTWITPYLLRSYIQFHKLGHAHSLEIWDGAELIGGIYGVWVGALFSAESMFHRRPYASKIAVVELASYLQSRGLTWMDIQVMTPHMEKMGAREIPRGDFLARIAHP